jgi:hypothetical protein
MDKTMGKKNHTKEGSNPLFLTNNLNINIAHNNSR